MPLPAKNLRIFNDFLKDFAISNVFIGVTASGTEAGRKKQEKHNKRQNRMARVSIPANPDDLIALSKSIVAKHAADGAGSPLAALNMADMGAKTTTADTQNQASDKLYRDAETATQNRDIALGSSKSTQGTVNYYVSSVRDMLLGLYKGNEQKLGDWGFTVDQSPQGGSKAAPQAKKSP